MHFSDGFVVFFLLQRQTAEMNELQQSMGELLRRQEAVIQALQHSPSAVSIYQSGS